MSQINRTDEAIDIYKTIYKKIHNDENFSSLNNYEIDSIISQIIQIQINLEQFENKNDISQITNKTNIFAYILIISPFIMILVYLFSSIIPKIYPTSNPSIQENNKVIDSSSTSN